jgi:hypothetical protein
MVPCDYFNAVNAGVKFLYWIKSNSNSDDIARFLYVGDVESTYEND